MFAWVAANLLRKLRYCSCRISAVLLMMFWNTSRSRAHVLTLLTAGTEMGSIRKRGPGPDLSAS